MPEPTTFGAAVLLLAHAGHWAVWILYAVPILAVLATIAVNARRDRRARTEREDGGSAPGESPPLRSPRPE